MTPRGFVHPDFALVRRVFAKQVPRSGRGGSAVCVYLRGECVVDLWAGTRDDEGNPWQGDTLAFSYSTTKGVLATLVHILVDRGMVDYDDPVAMHWPEFGQRGKEHITLRQILCHEAGLYDVGGLVEHADWMLSWPRMVELLEQSAPVHTPGGAVGYHGLTFGWLVGELIERISGVRLSTLVGEAIAEPLGLEGLHLGLPRSAAHRRARLVDGRIGGAAGCGSPLRARIERLGAAGGPVDPTPLEQALMPRGIETIDFNRMVDQRIRIPAIDGMFDARSLARLYAALAGGGVLDGARLLSERTLARATEVQNRARGQVIPLPMHWRLGYHRVPSARERASRAFGHFGIGGSGAWADPERELAVALVLNHGVGTPFGDTRIIRIGTAAIRSADRRGD